MNKISTRVTKPIKTEEELNREFLKLKADLVHELEAKAEYIDSTLEESTQRINDLIEEATEVIENLEDGEDGEDGESVDEEEIINAVVPKVMELIEVPEPEKIDQEAIVKAVIAQLPPMPEPEKIDEDKLIKDILKKVPKSKPSVKVLTEKVETDPMSIIDKIMALPEEVLKKFKFRIENVDGLAQTISAFRSQLARGYLHGSGGQGGGGGSQTPWLSNIDAANYQLNNLGEPSAVTDAATRGYVDNHFKVFVTTYNNGSVNNINLASAPATIDTITLSDGDIVLVAAQTSAIENGIYTFNGVGVAMTRTTGFTDDTSLRASIIQVNRGGANGRRTFANTNNFAITVGVTAITYGPLYNAGNFISFTGANTINVINTGIVPGTYGNASSVPQFFTYATGMMGSAVNVPIAITASQVTDFTSAVLAIVPPNVITRGRVVALARRI